MSDEKFDIKENTVSIFKVDPTKKKSEKSPDFNGTGRLKPEDIELLKENGGIIRISAWTKLPKSGGAPYISGFIEAQQERSSQPAPPEATDDFLMTPAIAQATSGIQDAEVVGENSQLPF